MKIESGSGGDPTKAIIPDESDWEDTAVRDAADLWFQESTDWLSDAAERRSKIGLRHGREGREMQGLDQIRANAIPPFWDRERGAWVFGFPHRGAVFQEFGARPHEIRAKKAEVLAFEWPDQPADVREEFEHTEGDLVFFESINHPGIPAIGFTRYGRDRARNFLERGGNSTEEFS